MEGQGVYIAKVADIKPGYSRYENTNLDIHDSNETIPNQFYEQLIREGIPGNIVAELLVSKYVQGFVHMPKTFDGLFHGVLADVKLMHPKQQSEYIAWKMNPEIDLSNKQAYFMQSNPYNALIICVTKVMNGDMETGARGRWKQPYTIRIDVLTEKGEIMSYDPDEYQINELDYQREQAMVRELEDDSQLEIGPLYP